MSRQENTLDLLAFAKDVADRAEAVRRRANSPVAVCAIDVHGNIVLKHGMEAPAVSIELAGRKAYASALARMRTVDLLPFVQPEHPLFPLMAFSEGRYCAIGGGAPLAGPAKSWVVSA